MHGSILAHSLERTSSAMFAKIFTGLCLVACAAALPSRVHIAAPKASFQVAPATVAEAREVGYEHTFSETHGLCASFFARAPAQPTGRHRAAARMGERANVLPPARARLHPSLCAPLAPRVERGTCLLSRTCTHDERQPGT